MLALVFGVVRVWAVPSKVPATDSTSTTQSAKSIGEQSNSTDTTIQELRGQVSEFEKEASSQEQVFAAEKEEVNQINDSAKILMTAAGIFALLLGAGSWKTLEDQRNASSENLKLQMQNLALQFSKALDESQMALEGVKRLRDELQRDFPMFGRMRNNFYQILQGLQTACIRLQPDDETYRNLDGNEEQQILFYENAIATSMLLDTKEYSLQLSEIYRLLGVFYGSRFFSKIEDGKLPSDRDDLNRARFYFNRAIDYDPKNYLAYMHAGNFVQYPEDPDLARASTSYFQRAAVVGPDYQRPWIAIAIIELEAFRDHKKASAALKQASLRPKYEQGEDKPDRQVIAYLEACSKCFLATSLAGDDQCGVLSSALSELEPILLAPPERVQKLFPADNDGCFSIFAEWPELKTRYEAALIHYYKAVTTQQKP
jgi:hypothetical protein